MSILKLTKYVKVNAKYPVLSCMSVIFFRQNNYTEVKASEILIIKKKSSLAYSWEGLSA